MHGGFADKTYTGLSGAVAYAYTVGAKGGGGNTSGSSGSNGADTTFDNTPVISKITAKGGTGGSGAASNVAGTSTYLQGNVGAASTNGDVNGASEYGFPGIVIYDGNLSNFYWSGGGGMTSLGGRGSAEPPKAPA